MPPSDVAQSISLLSWGSLVRIQPGSPKLFVRFAPLATVLGMGPKRR
jgi:hypothetical protein